MVIYEVRNKVLSILFESKKDAEKYLGENGTAPSGLWIYELYVVDTSKNKKGV